MNLENCSVGFASAMHASKHENPKGKAMGSEGIEMEIGMHGPEGPRSHSLSCLTRAITSGQWEK